MIATQRNEQMKNRDGFDLLVTIKQYPKEITIPFLAVVSSVLTSHDELVRTVYLPISGADSGSGKRHNQPNTS